MIAQHYLAGDAVETKKDGSPVTKADRDAETLMREIIRKTFPDHGIIGEEYGSEKESAEYVWVLDPIMSPWDLLPLIPVVRGAGGVITTWAETDASQGTSCVAANRTLHPTVIEMLNSTEARCAPRVEP